VWYQLGSLSQPVRVVMNTLVCEIGLLPLLDTHLNKLLLTMRHFERLPRNRYAMVRRLKGLWL